MLPDTTGRRRRSVARTCTDLATPWSERAGSARGGCEGFTVQALPPSLRTQAVHGVRRLVAPGGTLVAVQFVRGQRPADLGPPWLLDRAGMESFAVLVRDG